MFNSLISLIFIAVWGNLHEDLTNTMILFTLGSLLNTYSEILLVKPYLDFDYSFLTISQGVEFFAYTLVQYLFMTNLNWNSLISGGYAFIISNLIKLGYCITRSINDGNLIILPRGISINKEKIIYLFDDAKVYIKKFFLSSFITQIIGNIIFLIYNGKSNEIEQFQVLSKLEEVFIGFVLQPFHVY